MVGLVGTFNRKSQIVSLFVRQRRQLSAQVVQVQAGGLFIKLFGKQVNADLKIIWAAPNFNLCQDLIGKRVTHHEGRMSGGTSQIDEPPLG